MLCHLQCGGRGEVIGGCVGSRHSPEAIKTDPLNNNHRHSLSYVGMLHYVYHRDQWSLHCLYHMVVVPIIRVTEDSFPITNKFVYSDLYGTCDGCYGN